MPLSYSGSASGGGSSGTLATAGHYTDPAIPRRSQAQGLSGTDNRAYTRQVTGDELVYNQMNKYLDQNGAYIGSARRRGLEQSNARGMLNSSIAAGAAERSAIDAASPLAMQDASTYGKTQSENMGALNEGLMQQRDIMNQQEMARWQSVNAGIQAGVQADIARDQMAQDMQMQRERLAYEGEQAGLSRYHDLGMSQNQYGLQDYYGARQDDRTFRYGVASASIGQNMQDQSYWFQNFTNSYFENPDIFSPQDMGIIAGYGQTIAPSYNGYLSLLGLGG